MAAETGGRGGFGIDLTACWRPRVGMVTLALELAGALVAARPGRRVTFFCSRRRPDGLLAQPAILSPHRHELANKLFWLPFVEAQAELDAILYPYWPPPPWRTRRAPPAAVFVHDLAFRIRPDEVPWQQRAYLGTLLPPALRRARAIIVPSQSAQADLLQHFPLPSLEERVHVIPEGPTPFPPRPAPLPEGILPGFILAVGTVERRKNYRRLADAYRMLRQRSAAVPPLVVAGKEGWANEDTLRRLRAEPGVQLLGHVEDAVLLALYQHARLLAFPSLYEGFGLPLLDAFATGLPALISSTGALPEVAGGAALMVEAEQPEAIAAGLERLLSDEPLRRVLAERGRERAAEFSWQRAGAAVAGLLDTIAAREG